MAEELRRLADALSRLVKQHFDLARAELRQDASRLGQDVAVGAAALPFAVIGLLLVDLALAALLARALGTPGALALLGAVNLAVAGTLGGLAVRRFRGRRAALRGTAEELRIDREVLKQVGRGEVHGNGHRPPALVTTAPHRHPAPGTGNGAGAGVNHAPGAR